MSKYFRLQLYPLTADEAVAFREWMAHPGKEVFRQCVKAKIAEKVSEVVEPALEGTRIQRRQDEAQELLSQASDMAIALEWLDAFSKSDRLFKL